MATASNTRMHLGHDYVLKAQPYVTFLSNVSMVKYFYTGRIFLTQHNVTQLAHVPIKIHLKVNF